MNAWLCVRLAVVVFGGMSACLAPLGPAAKPPIGWLAMLIIFAFLSIGITFIFALQAVNPWSSKFWSRPSWTANPFNFKQPFQFFHLAAYGSLTQGTVLLARLLILRYPELRADSLSAGRSASLWFGGAYACHGWRDPIPAVEPRNAQSAHTGELRGAGKREYGLGGESPLV